jgi:sentrin-specific protease 7
VDSEDIPRLDEGVFPDDNLMYFYLLWLQHVLAQKTPDLSSRIYVHNTHFYTKLSKPAKDKSGINYKAVERWTTGVELLKRDDIIVAINEGIHWYVALICNSPKLLDSEPEGDRELQSLESCSDAKNGPSNTHASDKSPPTSSTIKAASNSGASAKTGSSPCQCRVNTMRKIIILDPLSLPHSATPTNLTSYLMEETQSKLGKDIPRPQPLIKTATNIPVQNNDCDCGPYSLGYIEP